LFYLRPAAAANDEDAKTMPAREGMMTGNKVCDCAACVVISVASDRVLSLLPVTDDRRACLSQR